MAEPYGDKVVLRSRGMQAVGAGMVAASVVGLVSAFTDTGATIAHYAPPTLLFGLLGWAAFWQPRVEVSDGGVTLVNTLRTIEVPWPAVQSVEGRYGLQLRTAYGAFTAWGASAPSGRERRTARPSGAAAVVQQRLDALREAGWLDDPRLERPRAQVRWHGWLIGAMVALVVASVVPWLLA